jgi:hypothetical protein
MNIDSHCTIKIHEFAAFEGWYWEIKVPSEIHTEERIKKFTLQDPGLGIPLILKPISSIKPTGKDYHVYKGGISDKLMADMLRSTIALTGENCCFVKF